MKILLIVLAYLIGAIPSGYLIFRLGDKKDIRSFGSGATGATNVLRLRGWKYALPVLVIDVLKSALPVWLILRLTSDRRLAMAAAVAVVLGHCFPVYLRFRGGKGVSTAMGAYAVLAPLPFTVSLAVFVGAVAATRFVSLGSLLGTLAFPFVAFLWKNDLELAMLGMAVFIIVAARHAGNIRRLIAGRERKLGQREGV
jgi:glycerol-3-phosphate acyltransferase PlsY